MRNAETRLAKLEAQAPEGPLRFRRVILEPGEPEPQAEPGELLIIRRMVNSPARHEDD